MSRTSLVVSTGKMTRRLAARAALPEAILICISGLNRVGDADIRSLSDALNQFARTKRAMDKRHKLFIGSFDGTEVVGVNCITDTDPGQDDLHEILRTYEAGLSGGINLAVLHRAAVSFFIATIDTKQFQPRLLLVHRSSSSLIATNEQWQSEPERIPLHVDCVFWHQDLEINSAQIEFDKLGTLEKPSQPIASYVLDVHAGSAERLFQAFALLLATPAHRSVQETVEQILYAVS